ncbi:MAG: glycosyltransferase family 4 protein [Bacteroidota bacterium]
MANRKQVVFCTDGIFPHAVGGMQRHSALLIEELARMNEMDLIVIHQHPAKVFPSHLNITEIPLNYQPGKGNYLLECYRYSKKVMEAVEKYPDAVIYSQGLSVWHNISKVGHRVIVNPHGLEPFQTIDLINYLKTAPLRMAFRYIYKRAAKIVSLGGKLTPILQSIAGKEKVVVLPNAVTIDKFPDRNYSGEHMNLLFVGRFAGNKGIHILMKAVEDLNKEGYLKRLHFQLAGKGPLYEEYIKKYNFPNVTFHGFTSDEKLKELYLENDAFVFPTLYEGMPTVVLEAMAAGMPVIVSDTGATAELVDHSNGFLIEKNNVRALKCAVQGLYQMTPQQRAQLSANSFERVKKQFTWPVVAQMHTQLFNTFRAG